MPKFSIPRPHKIYQNWEFWFENKPSGNSGPMTFTAAHSKHEAVVNNEASNLVAKKLATIESCSIINNLLAAVK
jgi:hypothetical protein